MQGDILSMGHRQNIENNTINKSNKKLSMWDFRKCFTDIQSKFYNNYDIQCGDQL